MTANNETTRKDNGIFISFEGGEGSGKTTLIRAVEGKLAAAGIPVLATREPGGIAIAERIREVLLDRAHTQMDARTEALLYAAARRQHLIEKVVPALEAGYVVLTDRYVDSSLAYQGWARGLGIDAVWELNRFAVDGLLPDRTILLDLDPAVGLDRIRSDAGREVNRLDLEAGGFHLRVREGYRQVARRYPVRVRMLDASLPPDALCRLTEAALKDLLPILAQSRF